MKKLKIIDLKNLSSGNNERDLRVLIHLLVLVWMQRRESGGLQRASAKPIRVVQDRRPFAPEGCILALQDLYQEDVYLHLRT